MNFARNLQSETASRRDIAAVMAPRYGDRAPEAALSLAAALTEYAAYGRAGDRSGHEVAGLILVSAALAEAAGSGRISADEIRPVLQMVVSSGIDGAP